MPPGRPRYGTTAVVTSFDQYTHLSEILERVTANPELRITVGMDYLIKRDVPVALSNLHTASGTPLRQAADSLQVDHRSDRVLNIRHERLQMKRSSVPCGRAPTRTKRKHGEW